MFNSITKKLGKQLVLVAVTRFSSSCVNFLSTGYNLFSFVLTPSLQSSSLSSASSMSWPFGQ